MISPEAAIPGVVFFSWKLTVEPGHIASGEVFNPIAWGEMSFTKSELNDALAIIGEFTRIEAVEAQGRISVRGAAAVEGDDLILEPEVDKSCTYDEEGKRGLGAGPFPSCDAKEDCIAPPEPLGPSNDCAWFVEFDTSDDCDVCTDLGRPDLCENPGFCATGGLELTFIPDTGRYRAEDSGSVFFGWADDVSRIASGADRGAFDLDKERRPFADEVQLSGADVKIGPLEVAFECAMGVLSRGPDGPGTATSLLSPAPNGALISCPIQGP